MDRDDLHADAFDLGFMAAEADVQTSKTRRVVAGLARQSETLPGGPALLLSGNQQGSHQRHEVITVKAESVAGQKTPPFFSLKAWH